MIRTLFVLCLLCFSSQFVLSQSKIADVEATFEETHVVFGEMQKGETRDTVYTFTNTGSETLEIDIVSGCECTTLDWTRGPILPGEKGTIDVHFDSSEKEESETVEIDVNFTNTNPTTGGPYWLILEYSFEFPE